MSLNLKSPPLPKAPTTDRGFVTLTPSVFDALPDSAYVRAAQLIQSPYRPLSTALLPFSAPTLWRKVKAGTFPSPIKLSERITAWNVGAVRAWLLEKEP
jgi:prophage regulatory protein